MQYLATIRLFITEIGYALADCSEGLKMLEVA